MGPSRIEGITHTSTTRGNAVSQGTPQRRAAHRSTSLAVLTALLVLVAGAVLAAAGPAAAAEDASRPVARIVRGPSCSAGGMVIDITARTTAYSVRLATTRNPGGEDSGTVQPGATLRLHGADFAYGETVDSRLEYTALDGSGTSYVDELDDWTMTRPSKADCDAVAAPSSGSSTASSADVAPSSSATSSSAAAPAAPTTDGTSSSAPQAAPASVWNSGKAAVTGIDAGGAYTLAGSGFQPGERVTVHLQGSGTVLASATAGPDGSVHARVQLLAADGVQSVDLVGDQSEVTAGVRLRTTSAQSPAEPHGTGNLLPLIAACVALVGTVAGLVSVLGARRSAPRFRSV